MALVVAIWGVLGYKLTTTIHPPETNNSVANLNVSFTPEKRTEKDTFSIQLAKRDPFLGTLYVQKTHMVKPKKVIQPKVVWPNITYHGIISKQGDKKQQIFVVSINNQQFLMKKGQVNDDITLNKGNDKQIYVSYKGNKKTITKT